MAEAYQRGIIFPNKKLEDIDKYHKGNLLDTETYTGGKVECLRTGVYRADFPTDFNLNPSAFQDLIESVEEILRFAISVEMPEEKLENAVNK
jgi:DNA polymerase epsilon subunit 1